MISRISIPVLLAALLFTLPAAAQRFGDTTDVVVIEVPVTVTRDGEPVRGLTAEDFEIRDGGKKQEIIGFEIVDLATVERFDPDSGPGASLPVAARRHFLFLFDMAFSQPEAVVKARQAAREVVDRLHPSDLAAVGVYTTTTGADLVLGFTSDREQLRLAIDTLGVPQLIERTIDPLTFVMGDRRSFESRLVIDGAEGGRGGLFEAIAAEQILENAQRISFVERTEEVHRISALTDNFEALAERVAVLDGRKYLVYFSEGFSSDTLIGTGGDDIETRRSAESGELWNIDGDDTFGTTQTQNELASMVEAFRRAGCIVQAINIAGLRTEGEIGERSTGHDSLNSLARDTGGQYFYNFNDFGAALDEMLEVTGVTYLLAFQPKKLDNGGKYRRLKVRLDNGRGLRVSHRAGYYAPRPFGELDEEARRLSTAELLMYGTEGGLLGVDALLSPFEVPGEASYVPVLLEIDGEALLAGGAEGTASLEIYAYAFGADGGVADFFAQRLGLDLEQFGDFLAQSGVKLWGHFDLSPGEYSVRMVIRDSRDGRASVVRRPLTVPDFAVAEPLLTPAFFPEAPNTWLLTREEEARQRQVDYPFLLDGQAFIPAARPRVAKGASAVFQVEGFHLPADAAWSAAVLDDAGAPVEKARVGLEAPLTEASRTRVEGQLAAKGLKPGQYVLEIEAGGERSTLPFVVE